MIKFEVGQKEKHEVSFDYNQFLGKIQILVDGEKHTSSWIVVIGTKPFVFQVGENEKHTVKIELKLPLWAIFRGSNVTVHVDNQLVRQDHLGVSLLLVAMFITPIVVATVYIYTLLH